ncbi:MAG: pyridoxal phosphate-dependent aminotransferase [Lachnospiraceae bacterium]
MQQRHGGDIYRNRVNLDFSVNINPLGIPKRVKDCLHEAVEACSTYPDLRSGELKKAIAGMLKVSEEYLVLGNGASELFMAIVQGLKPPKILIPVPSFYGYEYAAKAGEGEIVWLPTKEEDGFLPTEDMLAALTDRAGLLFLGNPSNPSGRLLKPDFLERLLEECSQRKIQVVVDESFMEFCSRGYSLACRIKEFDCLILIRSFTKSFAIPGVRLGYLLCAHKKTREKLQTMLPEWNLSVFAQKAGVVCASEKDFLIRTQETVEKERRNLIQSLNGLGFRVIQGEANFLLFFTPRKLYAPLLERGFLIRECSDFRGLTEGWYRIAVRTGEENGRLLEAIKEVISIENQGE